MSDKSNEIDLQQNVSDAQSVIIFMKLCAISCHRKMEKIANSFSLLKILKTPAPRCIRAQDTWNKKSNRVEVKKTKGHIQTLMLMTWPVLSPTYTPIRNS